MYVTIFDCCCKLKLFSCNWRKNISGVHGRAEIAVEVPRSEGHHWCRIMVVFSEFHNRFETFFFSTGPPSKWRPSYSWPMHEWFSRSSLLPDSLIEISKKKQRLQLCEGSFFWKWNFNLFKPWLISGQTKYGANANKQYAKIEIVQKKEMKLTWSVFS